MKFAARGLNGIIQSRGDGAKRIIHHAHGQVGIILLKRGNRLAGAILRAAIGNDHFHLGARIGLLAQSLQQQTDGGLLVITGNDYGNFWQHGVNYALRTLILPSCD